MDVKKVYQLVATSWTAGNPSMLSSASVWTDRASAEACKGKWASVMNIRYGGGMDQLLTADDVFVRDLDVI
jgi:hypothetical protein